MTATWVINALDDLGIVPAKAQSTLSGTMWVWKQEIKPRPAGSERQDDKGGIATQSPVVWNNQDGASESSQIRTSGNCGD